MDCSGKGIKVAIVRPSSVVLDVKGYNIQEIGLAKALFNLDVSVDVFMAGHEKVVRSELLRKNYHCSVGLFHMPFHYLPGRQAVFPKLLSLLSRGSYDLIQVHEDSQIMNILVTLFARRKRIPVILCQGVYRNYTGTARILQAVYDSLFLAILRNCVKCSIAKTRLAKDYLLEKGFKEVCICPVGLDPGPFLESGGLAYSAAMGERGAVRTLLYVGIIDSRRNVLFLMEVLDRLVRAGRNVRLIIAGDGPGKADLLSRVDQLSLGNHVIYAGKLEQSALGALYQGADALLLPSSYEIFGMVMLEAMYFGTPVFSTLTAGAQEVVKDGYNGFIIEELDAAKWKSRLELIWDDQRRYETVRRNAWETVRKRFLWEKAVEAYIRVYHSVTSRCE